MTHDAATLAAQRAVTEDTGPITLFRNRMDNRFLTKMGDNRPLGDAWVPHSVVGVDGVEVGIGGNQTAEAKALAAKDTVALPAELSTEFITYDAAVKIVADFLVSRPEILKALTQGAPTDPPLAETPAPVDAGVPTSGQASGVDTHG